MAEASSRTLSTRVGLAAALTTVGLAGGGEFDGGKGAEGALLEIFKALQVGT